MGNHFSWILGGVVAAAVGYQYLQKGIGKRSAPRSEREADTSVKSTGLQESAQKSAKAKGHNKTSKAFAKKGLVADKATHDPHFLGTFRGFSGVITGVAFYQGGNKLAISCTDCTLRVYDLTGWDGASPLPNLPYVRTVVEKGLALTAVVFGDTEQHVYGVTDNRRELVKFLVQPPTKSGKPLTEVYRSDNSVHSGTVRFLGFSGTVLVCASEDEETQITVVDTRGSLLANVDTKQVRLHNMCFSPLGGRFVGVAAWSPGVKLLEVVSKHGAFVAFERAMDLRTECGNTAVAISADNSKAVVATKNNELLLYNIDVRYQVNEDPRRLLSVKLPADPEFPSIAMMAFSLCGKFLAAASSTSIKFFRVEDLQEVETIRDAHTQKIRSICVSPDKGFLITGGADNRPRAWRWPSS